MPVTLYARMSKMKKTLSGFSFKAFAISLTTCGVLGGLIAWFTSVGFWYAFLMVLCAMLINGWIASLRDRSGNEIDK